MKARCHREGLLTACQTAMAVLPTRTTSPILRKIHFNVEDPDVGVLLATDLDQALRYRVSGVTTTQAGKVLLPTQELVAILRELSDEFVDISSTDSGLKIAGSSSKFEFPSEDPAEFPPLPEFPETAGFKLPAKQLSMMIKRTVFAAATEHSRYHMCSVLMEFDPNGDTRFVATDGKRLALMAGKAEVEKAPKETAKALAPPKAMTLLSRILADPDELVEIALGVNDAMFRTAKVVVYTRLVEGRFPPWQSVLPGDPPIKVPVTIDKFFSAVRQARIVTSTESKAVKFTFEDGSVILRGQGADVGESEVVLPIAYTDKPLEITFDPELLVDVLRVLDPSEEAILAMTDGRKAAVLKTVDGYQYVIMPVTRDK